MHKLDLSELKSARQEAKKEATKDDKKKPIKKGGGLKAMLERIC